MPVSEVCPLSIFGTAHPSSAGVMACVVRPNWYWYHATDAKPIAVDPPSKALFFHEPADSEELCDEVLRCVGQVVSLDVLQVPCVHPDHVRAGRFVAIAGIVHRLNIPSWSWWQRSSRRAPTEWRSGTALWQWQAASALEPVYASVD